jgi:hypothetical protein
VVGDVIPCDEEREIKSSRATKFDATAHSKKKKLSHSTFIRQVPKAVCFRDE